MNILTMQIKVINHIKIPLLPKAYVKQPKLPMHLRSCLAEHLNVFSKTISIHENWQAREAWSKEIIALKPLLPFKLAKSQDFGDTLIGCVCDLEFGDFYIELYTTKNWVTN